MLFRSKYLFGFLKDYLIGDIEQILIPCHVIDFTFSCIIRLEQSFNVNKGYYFSLCSSKEIFMIRDALQMSKTMISCKSLCTKERTDSARSIQAKITKEFSYRIKKSKIVTDVEELDLMKNINQITTTTFDHGMYSKAYKLDKILRKKGEKNGKVLLFVSHPPNRKLFMNCLLSINSTYIKIGRAHV